jgi:hypothetical protein
MAKHWIQDAIKHPGKLHEKLHVKAGHKISIEKINKALKSKSSKLREEAQFAKNMRGLHK